MIVPISGSHGTGKFTPPDSYASQESATEQASASAPIPSFRAPVLLAPASPRSTAVEGPVARNHAPFVAQLIATVEKLPQTRQRRREAPELASAAYGISAGAANEPLRRFAKLS